MYFAPQHRLSVARSLLVATCSVLAAAAVEAQPGPFFVPGRNVNTVGPAPPPGEPNPDLIGNPQQKQRNEVSCDVSPNNWLLAICGNNDYRGVGKFGDSWIGISTTQDGGLTWRSRLLSGFPGAPAGIGAADPVVRTVPGLALVNYITINRTDGRGTLALALLLERNKENGEPYEYLEPRLIGSGTPGRFNDKPTMLVTVDEGVTTTVDVGGRAIPTGTVHVAYSLFPGNENNSSSQIYHLMSRDYGATWTSPKKLSESIGINQGAEVAVSGSTVVVVWRRVADNNEPSAIMFVRSTDGGATWTKAAVLKTGDYFDQDTTATAFRTRSMPTIVHDGSAFHAMWSERGRVPGFPDAARIVVSSSSDGRSWGQVAVLDPHATADPTGVVGHQIMPVAATAGGRVQVNWVDTRNNEPGSFRRLIEDFLTTCPPELNLPDTSQCVYRQSGDVYAAQFAAQAPQGQGVIGVVSQRVSRYRFGRPPGATASRQLEYNFLNARMFKKGELPFHGDYHAVASQRYRPSDTTPGAWTRNIAASTSHAIFYSAFTDNRDVQGYVWASPGGSPFTPPPAPGMQGESGDENPTVCEPSQGTTGDTTVWTPADATRSRFQNIYAAVSLPGLIVASPSGSKPKLTEQGAYRAYVIFVQNLTQADATYTLSIASQPAGVTATWRNPASSTTAICADGAPCRTLAALIPKKSSISRTVYVTGDDPRPRVLVTVTGNGDTGSVLLNANPGIAEIENPDGVIDDILDTENYQPDILGRQYTALYPAGTFNADVTPVTNTAEAPRIEYPRIEYPRIEYPRIEYPRIEYPRIEYDAVGNPRIEYPRIEYPRIEYQSVENPRIEYSAPTGDVTELTWPVTTGGANTTTAVSSQVFVNGDLAASGVTAAQLLVSVPNFVTVSRACDGSNPTTIVENQVVVNVPVPLSALQPTETGPDTVNPPAEQPSFFVRPGQVVYVTLRLLGKAQEQLADRAGIVVRSQPDTTAVDASNDDRDGEIDTTAPELDLSSVTFSAPVEGNAPGGANVPVLVTASDPSAIASVGCTSGGQAIPIDGSSVFFPLGTTNVACAAEDTAGNVTTGGFTVTVQDKTAPVVVVPGGITVTASGPSGAEVTFSASSSDIVAGAIAPVCSISGTPITSPYTFPVGTTTVTCTASDGSGNSTSTTFTVTVTNTAPTITVPGDITVAATSAAGAAVSYVATGSDAEQGTIAAVCSPASDSTFPLGSTPVSCTVTDWTGAAATGTFTVTVTNAAPTITVPGDITRAATSAAGAVVTFSATGNDAEQGAITPACTPVSGTTFSLGTTSVTCTVTDWFGVVATGTFAVTVTNTAPTVSVPANITTPAMTAAGAVVSYTATGDDAEQGAITPACTPVPGTTFSLGTTQVTCTVTDWFGEAATGAFTVTVTNTAPTVTVPGNITTPATGATGAIVTFASSGSDAEQGSITPVCVPASGSTFPIGATQVTCTVTDRTGATASGTFTVTVTNNPPTFTPPANITRVSTSDSGAVVTFTATGSDIEDGPIAAVCVPASGTTFPLGVTTVNCTVTDSRGATVSGAFTVTITDGMSPVWTGASVTPDIIWPPNGSIAPVTVTARVTDAGSGVAQVQYRVVDEYGQYQPACTATTVNGERWCVVPVSGAGPYVFQVPLLQDRRGNDKDGRHYSIYLAAVDAQGNRATFSQPRVVNVHDQSGS